jgi:hypothetical protein
MTRTIDLAEHLDYALGGPAYCFQIIDLLVCLPIITALQLGAKFLRTALTRPVGSVFWHRETIRQWREKEWGDACLVKEAWPVCCLRFSWA